MGLDCAKSKRYKRMGLDCAKSKRCKRLCLYVKLQLQLFQTDETYRRLVTQIILWFVQMAKRAGSNSYGDSNESH